MPSQYHWCYADEELLRCIATGKAIRRGARGSKMLALVKLAHRLGLESAVIWLVALATLASLLWQQGRATGSVKLPTHVFVGFGAGSELALVEKYRQRHGDDRVVHLNQTDVRTFAHWMPVHWREAVTALHSAHHNAMQALQRLPPVLAPHHEHFATFICIRIAAYVHAGTWFAQWNQRVSGPEKEIAFLAADTTAYAATDAALPTRFIQHGLLTCCLLPSFVHIDALTIEEAEFYRAALPKAHTRVVTAQPLLAADSLRNSVLVASCYGPDNTLALINPVLAWAEARRLPVDVRLHPRESGQFWQPYVHRGAVSPQNGDTDFVATLQRLRPRLVVSWFSTVLAECLQCDVIPVTVCPAGDHDVEAMVYPLFRRSLCWPADVALIEQLLHDDDLYRKVLVLLQTDFGDVHA